MRERQAVGAACRAGAPATSPIPRAPLPWLAREIGNRSFSRSVARMRDGDGILPSGTVHPQVEAAIRSSRGRGRTLEAGVRARLEHALGEPLADVRVHTGEDAAALARAVSARAFTVGSDIYFSRGEYRPHLSGDSASLIAHEVAHVLQQRDAPVTGPLTVSQPGDQTELDAEAVARSVAA